MTDTGRLSAALPPKAILFAALLVAVAALVLGGSQAIIGPNTATSGYLTILFLLSVVRADTWRARLLSAGWSLAVALLGFLVGGFGLWVTLAALVLVSLVQGFVAIGETALLTRSPVNLLAFATLGQSGAEIWQVLLGTLIGSAVILGLAGLAKNRDTAPHIVVPARARIGYSVATAVGAALIVLGSELIGFQYATWTVLSFTIMLSVGADQRTSRGYQRVLGSIIGAIAAVLIAMLPAPFPLIAAVICLVLCVAYINVGNYTLFILYLTPAVLLTTASEHSLVVLGLYRIEAVLIASALALAFSFVLDYFSRRYEEGVAKEHFTTPFRPV